MVQVAYTKRDPEKQDENARRDLVGEDALKGLLFGMDEIRGRIRFKRSHGNRHVRKSKKVFINSILYFYNTFRLDSESGHRAEWWSR